MIKRIQIKGFCLHFIYIYIYIYNIYIFIYVCVYISGIYLRLQGKLSFPYNVKKIMVKYILLC